MKFWLGVGCLLLAIPAVGVGIFQLVRLGGTEAKTFQSRDDAAPQEQAVKVHELIEIKAHSTGKIRWSISPETGCQWLRAGAGAIHMVAHEPGTFTVSGLTVANGDIVLDCVYKITAKGPREVVPPSTAKAPPPAPVAKTNLPIPGEGLRVLIIHDDSAKWDSKVIKDWLDRNCTWGDTSHPEWRVMSTATNMATESALWQTAYARPRASTPWIVIANGTTGYEGPLPETTKEALNLLEKYKTP